MKKIILILFLTKLTCVFSQVRLVFKDAESKEPISFITIFNEKNEELAISNDQGEIFIEEKSKVPKTIYAKSIFYEDKKIELSKLKDDEVILLDPKMNLLDPVEVSRGKYVVLNTYYRAFNFKNKKIISFVDAEIKFVIKKKSIQKKIIQHRIFDLTPKDQYNVSSKNPFYVKDLDKKSLLESLNSKFNLVSNGDIVTILGKKDKKLYGNIKKVNNNNHKSNIKIDVSQKSSYFDGIKVEEYYNENLSSVSVKDLKYRFKEFGHDLLTDEGKDNHLSKAELFVQNVEYLSKDQLKQIMKSKNYDISTSHYTKEFWQNLESYTPINELVDFEIKTRLVERK